MSLKHKVGLILVVIFILTGLGNYAIQRFIIYPSFIALERKEARKDLQRSVGAIKREVYHLSNLCRDWSAWDDTYDFVESQSEDYIQSNLVLGSFTENEINLIYIIDINGEVVWGEIYDLETEEPIELLNFPKDTSLKTHPLISPMLGKEGSSAIDISGFFMTEQGPMLIASRQILTSSSEGPVRGFFIMGRLLNDDIVKTLADQTEVSFTVFPIKENSLPESVREIPERLTGEYPYLIEEQGHDNLLIYTMYPDIKGKPSILVQVKKPRDISAKGHVTMRYASISILILGLIILVAISFSLQGIVLRPIIDLTNHALLIGKTGDLSKRLSVGRRDEIGILNRELNTMLEKLELQSSELAKVNKKLKDGIARRKKAEKALRESEEKLNRMKRMEALGLLAGGVAHDLNNILSGVTSYPELLLMDDDLSPEYRKSIEMIQVSGRKAAMIVEDLLTIARGVATSKEIININDIVEEYMFSPEYKKLIQHHPSITIKTHLDSELLNISGAPVHIGKVVMNLVSNAAESMRKGGNVIISTINRYLDRPVKGYDEVNIGEYAVLSVSDEGSGISKEDVERIFEPFYTKKVLGRSGTGLGLAVVWNTVQDHKGYIDVETSEKGTTFSLYFPITRGSAVEKESEVTIEELKGKGQMILVIDDEESQRKIACAMLTKLDYNVEAVESGEEAIEYLKEHKVDLIVLDMIMDPGINGREAYEMIIEIHPNQKAVIASGFSETEEVRKAQQLGAGQYIKKPYSLQKIAKAIKHELEK